MKNSQPYDLEDPFGSRPDEKPPAGWDEGFWRRVRDRIEAGRQDPSAKSPPPPPRRLPMSLMVAGLLLAGAGAAAARLAAGDGEPPSRSEPPTLVLVDGSRSPSVTIEWARRGGREWAYVILETYGPETTYVVLDRPEAGR